MKEDTISEDAVSAENDDTVATSADTPDGFAQCPEPEYEPAPLAEESVWALQCLLFVGGEPLDGEELARALEIELTDIPHLCEMLNERLKSQGLHVVQLAGGYALATRPQYADYVQRLLEPEPEKLSLQALETLAIVAYRQPITRPEIDAMRGVNSGGVVASLLEKGLLRIRGRKDAPGRPFLLETTAQFLSAFGLKDLGELPGLDLPEIGSGEASPRILGEALEELSEAMQSENEAVEEE